LFALVSPFAASCASEGEGAAEITEEALPQPDRLRNEGQTIVPTMHDLTVTGRCTYRLAPLASGPLAADGSAAQVLAEQHLAVRYNANMTVTSNHGSVMGMPRITPRTPRTNQA
jgi:ABC-type hemin transport system ATPase subunit